MTGLFKQYVTRPLRTILANGSVVVLIGLAFVLDRASSNQYVSLFSDVLTSPAQLLSAGWAYDRLPAAISALASSGWLAIITITIFLVQAFIGFAIIFDFRLMYQRQRRGFLDTVRRLPLEAVLWYLLWVIFIHVAYVGIAALFYLPSLWLWQTLHVNTLIPLLAIAVLFFPSYYAFQSIGAKMAALPLTWQARLNRMRFLLKPQSLKRVYVFYPIRLSVEFVVLVGVSAITFALLSNRFLAFLTGMLALLVPIAVLRASTFEFFLDLYCDDSVIQKTFAAHFAASRQSIS